MAEEKSKKKSTKKAKVDAVQAPGTEKPMAQESIQQKPVEKKTTTQTSAQPTVSDKKDPKMAALVAVVGTLFGAAGIGYAYLGNVKKAAIYVLASWALWAVVMVGFVVIGGLTGVGLFCCLPVFLIPLLLNLVIIWDVYLEANGDKTKLPNF
ncbi:hypothetical protein HZC07_03540 [Candidatus Micrarchaeota archaeon]|nr:hypothetical protein [Candidatus Micrarchaeota archaeon]